MPSPLFEGLGMVNGFGGDPEEPYYGKKISKYDQIADLRDYLANLVGFGSKSMNENVKNDYGRLISMYGKPLADKILNHVFVFNNRSDIQRASPEERINAFYAVGSRDKDLQNLFTQAKTFGGGPMSGFNYSFNQGNKLLRKGLPLAPVDSIPEVTKSLIEKFK